MIEINLLPLELRGKKLNQEWYWYIVDMLKSESFSFNDIHQLYRLRWNIEESFKEIKTFLGSHDLNGLSHPNCVQNQIYIALITWISLKGFTKRVAKANRKSENAFCLSTILKGKSGIVFINILFSYISGDIPTMADLKRHTKDYVESWYSKRRANSSKRKMAGKAIARMGIP